MSAVLLPQKRWRYLEGQFEINARIKAQARVRDAYREFAAQELAIGHGHTVNAYRMAKLADATMVCMGGGEWHVWGPSKRFPDPAEVERAEAVLRGLWREKVAVPAYNYGSWQGCMEYVPWTEWRAERRPTLDSPCFTTDYAEMDRRIYAKAGKDEEEQEEDRCPGATVAA